jgi:hypothetical protein
MWSAVNWDPTSTMEIPPVGGVSSEMFLTISNVMRIANLFLTYILMHIPPNRF